MIGVLLALTLAVVAAPPPAHPTRAPRSGGFTVREGCPSSAIGFYRFTPRVKVAWLGALVEDRESYGGGGSGGGMYNGTLHFWSNERGRPRGAAVAQVDPETHELHAIAGTVRKVGGAWCMFSMPEPIPAKYLRDPR